MSCTNRARQEDSPPGGHGKPCRERLLPKNCIPMPTRTFLKLQAVPGGPLAGGLHEVHAVCLDVGVDLGQRP